jgi:CheY-like chemotaxis protein
LSLGPIFQCYELFIVIILGYEDFMPIAVTFYVDAVLTPQKALQLLPAEWDVTLTCVHSGKALLDALRSNQGEIVFFDLDMPEIGGMEVLELLHREELNALPIVLSDQAIADSSCDKVSQLGAIACLNRNPDPAILYQLLHDYGLIEQEDHSPSLNSYPWLNELFQCAIAEAARRLGSYFRQGVYYDPPKTRVIKNGFFDLSPYWGKQGLSELTAQGFKGDRLPGEFILSLGQAEISSLLQYLNQEDGVGRDLLIDVSGILNGAVIRSLFEQLDRRYSIDQPVVLNRTESVPQRLEQQLLNVEIHYRIGGEGLDITQLLLLTTQSVLELERIYAHLEEI